MNERIKKLAVQANPASKEIYESDSWQFNCAAWSAEDLKKFAELIVQECSKVITYGGYWSGGPVGPRRQATPPEIAKMIREHFGVE